MRSARHTRAAHRAKLLAALHMLSHTHLHRRHVGIEGHESKSVVHHCHHTVAAVTLRIAARHSHHSVARGIYRRTLSCRQVYPAVQPPVFQYRMESHAETTHHLAPVLGNRHYGRHRGHALALLPRHAVQLVERLRLHIEALRDVVHLHGGTLQQLAALHLVKLGITLHAPDTAVPLVGTHRLALKDGPVKHVIALLQVHKHLLGTVHPVA